MEKPALGIAPHLGYNSPLLSLRALMMANLTPEKKFQLWGWMLFVICALLYMVSAIESGSVLGLLGSIVFLIACVLFLIPLIAGS